MLRQFQQLKLFAPGERLADQSLSDPSTKTPVAAEIRDYVRKLPKGERLAFATKAARNGDLVTASAVLSGPAYLSGLTDDAVAQVRAAAAGAVCPGDWRQLQAADKIGSYLSARVETFAREVRKIRPDAKKQTAAAQAISKLMGAE